MSEGLKIAVLCCNYTNLADREDFGPIPAKLKVQKFPCGGHIEITDILRALREGADGVLVAVCEEGKCHNEKGNVRAEKRVLGAKKILEEIKISPERVKVVYVKRQDTGDFIENLMNFYKELVDIIDKEL
jgi:coenzyme F420-reducing hydrogenase delta subunit